ncbi:lysozyme inhibitor [Paracoccus sp. YIM 132242]|uniref:Lysozyme inhibitor n=1 Tax=Paracoccus lichenicola TaxID=2665644 RepID=A0A6L6HVJ1_9RHOB|nr:MliC family protein [Paracoccus lichenicola]MTE01328.1 lysozyme inhibitor [Paracoccus lichenicola]
MIRILIPAFAGAATMALAQTGDLIPVTYVCERGAEVPVVFVNPDGGQAYAVAQIDGKLLGMRNVVSASGARYRSGDGADAYQLWSKGDGAFISFGADGQDQTLFQDCRARE